LSGGNVDADMFARLVAAQSPASLR